LIGAIVNFKRYWKLVAEQYQQEINKIDVLKNKYHYTAAYRCMGEIQNKVK
jgi:hypothetical protein